ncbi:AMSH-like ubiquitin thioesterase 3 [Camellia lanceoleosa]|uniref:AMSH-like ubiquitin thioesterase 3 n=1 Tax=Camellia lanceoleosa TaxID=1840588 RepID=A0ACC0I6M2_9ERIC|nr:AMSH-like ubiquitin thioesterase 3 [Camellia lanceoleosa]
MMIHNKKDRVRIWTTTEKEEQQSRRFKFGPQQKKKNNIKMMDDFLRLARENTAKNLETCGVLAGSLKNRVFHITTLIVPKQESTSDSTLNEEEIFEVQGKYSLFPFGWIHEIDELCDKWVPESLIPPIIEEMRYEPPVLER